MATSHEESSFRLFGESRLSGAVHHPPMHGHELLRVLALVLFAWLPLVILSAAEGGLVGGRWPLLGDVAVHVRLLIELPALLTGKHFVDLLSAQAVAYFPRAGMIPPERVGAYRERLGRVYARGHSWGALIALLGLSFLLSYLEYRVNVRSDWWRVGPDGSTSLAGVWYYVVARPLVVMQLLTWLWMLVLWAKLLLDLLRFPLILSAYHPDKMAGLGPIVRAHGLFAILLFALSSDLAGGLANYLLHIGGSFDSFRVGMATFVVVSTTAVLAPLLIASPRLIAARQQALLERGEIACVMSQRMHESTNRALAESVPETNYPLFDSYWSLTESTILVERTRPVPITRNYLLLFVLAAALPLALTALTEISAKDALKELAKFLTI